MIKEKIYKAKFIVKDSKNILKDSCLIINGNIIEGTLDFDDLSEDQKKKLHDLGDVIVAPGLVNAHSHVALNSVKGLGYGRANALYDIMWGIEPSLEFDDVYKLSQLGILDALKSGTTSINDHYFFSEAVFTFRVVVAAAVVVGWTFVVGWIFFVSDAFVVATVVVVAAAVVVD